MDRPRPPREGHALLRHRRSLHVAHGGRLPADALGRISQEGYTQGLAISRNGEITGEFRQVNPLFKKDGGHGMIFRTKEGKLMMALHAPNHTPLERPYFFEVIEEDGLLKRK